MDKVVQTYNKGVQGRKVKSSQYMYVGYTGGWVWKTDQV